MDEWHDEVTEGLPRSPGSSTNLTRWPPPPPPQQPPPLPVPQPMPPPMPLQAGEIARLEQDLAEMTHWLMTASTPKTFYPASRDLGEVNQWVPCATLSMLTCYRTWRSLHFPLWAVCSLSGSQPEMGLSVGSHQYLDSFSVVRCSSQSNVPALQPGGG